MTHIRQQHLEQQNFREIVFGLRPVGAEINAHVNHVAMVCFDDVVVEPTQKHIST